MNRAGVAVTIEQLSRSFREGERLHRVLEDVDLRIEPGELAALLGRSGSGKSTLLNLICGIDTADHGSVRLDDTPITALPERERTLFRRRHIGFVYQFFNLIPTLTVEENVALPLALNGQRDASAARRVGALLDAVGLSERAGSFPDVLSGGEQQRVAIARALAHRPRLVLADEPTGNLDDETAVRIIGLLRDLTAEAACTLVIATHSEEIAAVADRTLALRGGRLEELPVGGTS